MTATDELRRMLDKRGVKHFDGMIMTYTDDADYMPSASNTFDVTLYNLTPAQAVEATLGRDRYSYEQWREISNAVGDAMEYAHDRAIEHSDVADPLWNLDEYVNRILKVAFEGEATLGRSTCEVVYCEDACGTDGWYCNGCGEWFAATFRHTGHNNLVSPHFCPNCGAKVVDDAQDDG